MRQILFYVPVLWHYGVGPVRVALGREVPRHHLGGEELDVDGGVRLDGPVDFEMFGVFLSRKMWKIVSLAKKTCLSSPILCPM